MTEPLTQTIQNYLKTIYEISADGQSASTTALASRLGIAPASVTGMIQRLATSNPPLLDYVKHQGVTLTDAGQKAALEIIRHHRLIETYLVNVLGYSWDEVHDEACRLEHVISENFEARIADVLGHPSHDPHGEPIPTVNLVMPEERSLQLSELRPPQEAIIQRVRADDPAFLRHLENLGLTPNKQIKIENYSAFDRNLTVSVEGQAPVTVGILISNNIYVKLG